MEAIQQRQIQIYFNIIKYYAFCSTQKGKALEKKNVILVSDSE